MRKKRLSMLFGVLALVILVAVGSWIAGSSIKSPAEEAARTAPPTPSLITHPVEERTLETVIVTRGSARFGLPQTISIVPSLLKADAGVITTLPAPNTQINEGDQLLTASGRPVFVLQGTTPTFRDLRPGVSGDDVRQLEAALQRLGFDPGLVDGRYDQQTSTAVGNWYTAKGWEPFGPTAEQLAEIRTLAQELSRAIGEKEAATDNASTAPLAIEAARANADSANKVADAEVAAKLKARDQLVNSNATAAEIADANVELEAAQSAARAIQLEGEKAIQEALNAQKVAEREVKLADDFAIQLSSELEALRGKAGIQIPADEIVFVPAVPVRVDQVDVAIGDTASGSILTVTNNQLSIDSSLPLREAPLVKPGMAVTIDEPELGVKATGVVARVAETSGTDGVDGFHVYFETQVSASDAKLDNLSLRLTIPVASTGGAVLVVPLSAVSLTSDNRSIVQVENNGALTEVEVEVGLAADGYVAVTPKNGGVLTLGQPVLIGENSS
ncbi:MAG: peptidoglycan-binding protein [Caldilineaceae bacterium]